MENVKVLEATWAVLLIVATGSGVVARSVRSVHYAGRRACSRDGQTVHGLVGNNEIVCPSANPTNQALDCLPEIEGAEIL